MYRSARNVDSWEVCACVGVEAIWVFSVLFAQFWSEPKTVRKNKVYLKGGHISSPYDPCDPSLIGYGERRERRMGKVEYCFSPKRTGKLKGA